MSQEEAVKSRISLEAILVTEIGQFGRYQKKVLALAAIAAVVAALSATEYIFTTARIDTRCLIPECEAAGATEFSPSWIANAIPPSGSSFDNCARFANTTGTDQLVDETCPATLFNRPVTVDCESYVYENTHSVAYDYELACNEWSRSFIGSVRTFGTLTALPLTGFISDRFGRRPAMVINAFNTAWIGILRYWADTYVGFIISQFFEAFVGSGTFSCVYILLMELVGPKYRVIAGATSNTFFALGQILVGFVAMGVPYWRTLTLTLYIPQLLVISYYWVMPESIRWYQTKGRHDKAEEALKNVARVNRKELSDKTLAALKATAEEANKNANEPVKKDWLVVQVFRHKRVLLRCCTSPVWWITTTFVYYGLTINAINLVGNMYLNFVAVAAVEIPGFWLAVLLMNRVGRRPVLSAGYFICALCQIGYIFIDADEMFGVSLTVYLIGKCAISMVGTTMYVYTAELYPTEYRHSLFAFSSMMGRIGSILAPLTPALGDAVSEILPFILFACLSTLSGALVLVTPETLGSKMPDTLEEAANIGRKDREKVDVTQL